MQETEFQHFDLCAARDAEFGQKTAVPMPDKVTRSFLCECKSAVFADGTIREAPGAEQKALLKPKSLENELHELAEQYRRDTTARSWQQDIICTERVR